MPETERRLQRERTELVDRGAGLWQELEQMLHALDSHPT
jgi:hypothetical protein